MLPITIQKRRNLIPPTCPLTHAHPGPPSPGLCLSGCADARRLLRDNTASPSATPTNEARLILQQGLILQYPS